VCVCVCVCLGGALCT